MIGKYVFRIEYKGKLMRVAVGAHDPLEVMKILNEKFPGYRGIVE